MGDHEAEQLTDNVVASEKPARAAVDEAVARAICSLSDELRLMAGPFDTAIAGLAFAPHDQARVDALVKCMAMQHKFNRKVYELIANMNKFYGDA